MDFPWKTQHLSSKEINIYNLYIFLKNFQHSPEQRLESQQVHDGPMINISHYAYKLLFMLVFATNPQIIQILPARALWQLIHAHSGMYFPACEELGPHF